MCRKKPFPLKVLFLQDFVVWSIWTWDPLASAPQVLRLSVCRIRPGKNVFKSSNSSFSLLCHPILSLVPSPGFPPLFLSAVIH